MALGLAPPSWGQLPFAWGQQQAQVPAGLAVEQQETQQETPVLWWRPVACQLAALPVRKLELERPAAG